MKLQNELYTLRQNRPLSETEAIAEIELHPECSIYQAHFPGHPITPGACIHQIIQELAESWLGRSLCTQKIVNLKFLMVIDPLSHPSLEVRMKVKHMDETSVHLLSDVFSGETPFSKASIVFSSKLLLQ